MKKNIVSIILPTYNEAESICILIQRIIQVLEKQKEYQFEVIIIDDNSPDQTAEKVINTYKNDQRVKIFIRKKTRGLGTAIGFGILKAKGNLIIGMDADGNHPPGKIPLMLKEINNFDMIQASRFLKKGGYPLTKDIFRHTISFSVNLFFKILGFPVWDSTCGYYAIHKNKLMKLGIEKIYYGYGDYHLRLVYFAKRQNYRIKEISCIYTKRIGGRSKSKLWQMFFSYLWEGIRLRFLTND